MKKNSMVSKALCGMMVVSILWLPIPQYLYAATQNSSQNATSNFWSRDLEVDLKLGGGGLLFGALPVTA